MGDLVAVLLGQVAFMYFDSSIGSARAAPEYLRRLIARVAATGTVLRTVLSVAVVSSLLSACGGGADSQTGADSRVALAAVASGRETTQAVTPVTGVTAQYVRLQSTSEVNGNPWSSMAEFNLVGASGSNLSRTGWSVVADSQEMVGEVAPATNAIDGDPNTIWHTQWQGGSPPPPHTFTVNLGSPQGIAGFKYLPRQVGTNGRIAGYRFYTSTDGSAWTLAASGSFPNTEAEQTVLIQNQAPVLGPLANRIDPVGRSLTQPVIATDTNGDTLGFSATGLPAGLVIDATTGLISGSPITVGTYPVTVQVTDGRAAVSGSFTWSIAAASGVGVTAQYVRLEAISEVNGNPWTSIAEFNITDAGGSTVARTGWTVSADSAEMVGENAPATNAIDGDANSIWHTQWQSAAPTPPHALTVNLGALRSIGGFRYLPRQVGENGRIAGYRFYTSANGTTWTLATEGIFPNSAAENVVSLNVPANVPPALSAVSSRSDAAGQAVAQQVIATDANGDTLTYSASGLPTGLSINAASGLIAGTPSTAGTFTVALQVSDGRAVASGGFTWTIVATPNRPPVLTMPANRADVAGTSVTQTVTATDPDGDPLSYAAIGLPTGLSINASSGVVGGTPGAVGTFTVGLQISDGRAITSGTFTWTIRAANRAPFLTVPANRTDMIGTPVAQPVPASDPDGDALGYAASGLPNGLVINAATGAISGTPTAIGSFNVNLQVSDGRLVTAGTFTWTIAAPPNRAPALTVPSGRTDQAGTAVVQAVQASDPDGDTLGYAASGLPTGLSINAASGTISGTPSAAGSYAVNLQVSDGRLVAAGGFTWTITAAPNRPPLLAALSNRTDPSGSAVSQAIQASDPDGDTLAYSASGLPAGLGINATTGLISGTPGATGSFTVTVQVSDGKNSASGTFTWTITAVSAGITARFVRLEAISEVNGNPWTSMAEFNVTDASGAIISRAGWTVVADSEELVGEYAPATNAIDGDPNTIWHTQWQGNAPLPPHTFTVNLGTSRTVGGFKYLPRQVGTNGRIAGYRFYTSTDGTSWQLVTQGSFASSTAEQTGTIPTGIVNRPPVLATLPTSRQDALGASVTLRLVASDPDGDTLTYAATPLPTGMSINPASGLVSGTANTAGTFFTTVTVSDGRGGSATQTFNWIVASSTPPSGASGTNPPLVFNASTSAVAGDVIYLQGESFGGSPTVYFDGSPNTALEIVNRVGTGWLAVQIPTTAIGTLKLRIANGTGISAVVKLNAAIPHHLDTTELAPGGAFRLFGRNLKVNGATPSVTVNGSLATIDVANSNEHLLLVTAPSGLSAASLANIVVDNGNGGGAAQLDRPVSVVASSGSDPFSLGVGWGASFATIAGRPIYPASDTRIPDKAQCNGSHDDYGAIQQAIDLAASNGGGVVQLASGRCMTSWILTMRSNVVLRGAGKTSTEIYHTISNYPVIGQGVDKAGLMDLTVTSPIDSGDGMIFKENTHVFVKNVKINLGTSRQMYMSDNVNFVFANSDVVQNGNTNEQGPYTFSNTQGLVFENNTTTWASGAPTFGRIHDSSIRGNRFTRNATNQNTSGAVHTVTLDFAYRVSMIGNTLDVLGGPITNKLRNDGETILTEGGGAARTENVGTVGNATGTTMTDTGNTINVDPFGTGTIPEDYGIAIVAGKGMGQTRHVTGYSSGTKTLTIDRAWDSIPDGSSRYATFVFGLEKALIKGNTLSQNPRGIWLYNTGVRDVDLIGNTISEGGGIYLRSYQQIGTKTFTPIYGVLIRDNTISNTTGNWMSYINVVMVNGDGSAFGTGIIGVEVRNNALTDNRPNVYSNVEEYAGTEGMMARMPLESGGAYQSTGIPRLLGTIFNGNTCTYCDVAVRIGTGSNGTTILNTRLPGSTRLYTDTSSVPTGETATGTIVR